MQYFDKNEIEIKAGYTIKHNNGETEKVYKCGNNELGVNASKKDSPCFNGLEQCYPLSEFDLSEWEIIDKGEKDGE